MAELLARLSEAMVRRRDSRWDSADTWLENAQEEHARLPFHAILARSNPHAHPRVLIADDLGEGTPLWALPRGRMIARTSAEMAAAVANLLRMASVVVFVDPHFGPEKPRHRRPIEAFLRAAFEGRPGEPPVRLEVHSNADGGATEEFFRDECERQLPGCVPAGTRLILLRVRQRPGGERLHNRYILTELGGVMFGVGLDEGAEGDTDDIQLLDRAQYEERWRQYGSETPAFDRPEPAIAVEGAGRG